MFRDRSTHWCAAPIVLVLAGSAAAHNFTQVVSFGDSLSDTGNVSNATFGFAPGGNYFNGRYSNGLLWNEIMAGSLNLAAPTPSRTGGRNFSHAGVKTGSGNTTFVFFSFPNVGPQVTQYANANGSTDTQLFTVWAGANNFLDNLSQHPTTVVNDLVNHVTALNNDGARHIIVPNLPLLGFTPRYNGNASTRDAYNDLTSSFNTQLASAMTTLDASLQAKVYQFDVASAFGQILASPGQFGLTNIAQPALVNGNVVPNPDEYLFYDDVHPTRIGHRLLGIAAFDLVTTHNWVGGTGTFSEASNWDAPGTPAAEWICRIVNSTGAPTTVNAISSTQVRQVHVIGSAGSAELNLSHGAALVATESIRIASGGVFSTTGSIASVVTPTFTFQPGARLAGGMAISGDLLNAGSLAPSNGTDAIGTLAVNGDFTQTASGALEIDLAPLEASHDRVAVTGSSLLDGQLRISAVGTTPLPGSSYDVMTYGSVAGEFDLVNATTLAGLRFSAVYSTTTLTIELSALPGDANLDAIVDIGDFALLAASFNAPGNWLAGNFNGDAIVDIGDFALLGGNFNQTTPPQIHRSSVPEPSAALAALVAMLLRRRR